MPKVTANLSIGGFHKRIDVLVDAVRGPVRAEALRRIGERGLTILREEMPEGKTGDLRAKATYAVFQSSQHKFEIGWWSSAKTSDGKFKDKIVNQGKGQPDHTASSPGRYVPAIGKRLVKGRQGGIGLGIQAVREWAQQKGLKMPFKRPKITKMPIVYYDTPSGQADAIYVSIENTRPYQLIDRNPPKGQFRKATPIHPGDIAMSTHKPVSYDPVSYDSRLVLHDDDRIAVMSFHEHVHAIIDYNIKYGTKDQKNIAHTLRWRMPDYATISEQQNEPAIEVYLKREQMLVPAYARQRAMTRLRKRGWTVKSGLGPYGDDYIEGEGEQFVIEKANVGMAHVTIYPGGREAKIEMLEARGEWRKGRGRETYNEVKGALKLMGVKKLSAWSEEEPAGFWRKMGMKQDRPKGISWNQYGGGDLTVGLTGIGIHPGSKRTPFYQRAARRIHPVAKGIMIEVLEAHNV